TQPAMPTRRAPRSLPSVRIRRRPRPSLSPYTTPFRSKAPATAAPTFSNETRGGNTDDVLVDRGLNLSLLEPALAQDWGRWLDIIDRKSTRLNSSHVKISYAVFCLKKKSHSGTGEGRNR